MTENASDPRPIPRLIEWATSGSWAPARARPYVPALAILALALAATAISAWAARQAEHQAARDAIAAEAQQLREAIEDVGKAHEVLLRSGASFVNAAGTPTRDTWRRFVKGLDIDREFPGMQGYGFVEIVPADRIAAHEAAQRAAGRPDYRLTPDTPREFYTAIVFLEPDNWRNARAIGFDMSAEAVRREAMDRARDTGAAVLSGLVTLIQETDNDVQPGALLYPPPYEGGVVPSAIEQRRERLRGFVYGAFRLHNFFQRSLAKHSPLTLQRLHVQAFAEDAKPGDPPFFDSASSAATRGGAPAVASDALHIDDLTAVVGGRPWRIRVRATASYTAQLRQSTTYLILATGTLLSLLTSSIAASLAYSSQRAVAAARRLEIEIADRKRAQDEVQLANGELIHRVKNTLTVVAAIATQTSRNSGSVPEFVTAFRDRLVALGRVHDLLRPDPAYSPELRSFTRELLAAYSSGGPAPALTIDGPHLHVPRNEAVLLSLLFNELATNATKYGAWSAPGGVVAVRWTIEAGDAGDADTPADTVVLSWTEQSPRPVAAPQRKGFGTSVLTAIERGLRGRLTVDYRPEGLRAELRFPAPAPRPEARRLPSQPDVPPATSPPSASAEAVSLMTSA